MKRVKKLVIVGVLVNVSVLILSMYAMENKKNGESEHAALNEVNQRGQAIDVLNAALFKAVRRGNVQLIAKLLQEGADVDEKEKICGNRPLMIAAAMGHVEIISLLLDSKASVDERNNRGFTPLMKAAQRGHCAAMQLLIAGKADVDAKDKNGFTSLTMACFRRNAQVVSILLDNNAGTEADAAYLFDGMSFGMPLMHAIASDCVDTVRLLIDKRADINIVLKKGNLGPLKIAMQVGNAKIVKMLLDAGADYGVMDEKGKLAWSRVKPKIQKIVIKAEKERMRKYVGKQDWQPEELLSIAFLEDITPLKQIVCDYAHCGFYEDHWKDQMVEEQIVYNKRKKVLLSQRVAELCKDFAQKVVQKSPGFGSR